MNTGYVYNAEASARWPVPSPPQPRARRRWSILIIRDALHNFTCFDESQKSLNNAPNMLTRRLSALVDPVSWRAAATASGRRARNMF